jgi:hypothetical protein
MKNPIRGNKLLIFGLLQAVGDGIAAEDKTKVADARTSLSLISQLETGRPDELTSAVRKVFDLSGRWERGAATEEELDAIATAVEDAIALLNKPEFDANG